MDNISVSFPNLNLAQRQGKISGRIAGKIREAVLGDPSSTIASRAEKLAFAGETKELRGLVEPEVYRRAG